MVKLITKVDVPPVKFNLTLDVPVFVLGSCFAASMAGFMADAGFRVTLNPFGTLYNPQSLLQALERIAGGKPFTSSECVEMGAGAGLICSFSHHTSFARPSADEFLKLANASLAAAHAGWAQCGCLIVTLGTARVWKHDGVTVANCLKRPAAEFSHEMMSAAEVAQCVRQIASLAEGRKIIFTVSPIRHLGDGAHLNAVSKATLMLGLEGGLKDCPNAAYFPSYEIVTDELRDYRFYAEDLVHPSDTAEKIVWERFIEAYDPQEAGAVKENLKETLARKHRRILSE